jgi:starch-binding outer membrane protein, SusD/RagB family
MEGYSTIRAAFTSTFRKVSGVCFLILSLSLPACEGFLDVGVPRTQLVSSTAFDNEGTARAAVLAVYSEMMAAQQGFASGGGSSVSLLAGLSADELVDVTESKTDFQNNSLLATNNIVENSLWAQAYKCIYYSNKVVEGLAASTKLSPEVKDSLEGEAKFLRAFIYFYLTNLFGEVPLILGTDAETNNRAGKVSSGDVYQQIVLDLNDAQQQLPVAFEKDNVYGRARAGRYAAKALLARVYLYLGEWAKAETAATEVIGSGIFKLEEIDKVFLSKNNDEAIWQLMPAYEQSNGYEPLVFFLLNEAVMTDDLVGIFGVDDLRLYVWMVELDGGFAPFKYKALMFDKEVVEYSMVLRLAEQYLIRAEARAQLGDGLLPRAAEDLNEVRGRAGISLIDIKSTQSQLLEAIELERRKELFSEWGHRWLDLKRTNRADAVLGQFKGALWEPTDVLYPIPAAEIVQNPNLGPQNLGY